MVKDLEDLAGDLAVDPHARSHANRLGAAPQRFGDRHRRAHAEAAHRVVRRRDDSAAAHAADDQGLAAQLRVIALLHGRIERVHVDVQYRPEGHHSTVIVIFWECTGGWKERCVKSANSSSSVCLPGGSVSTVSV